MFTCDPTHVVRKQTRDGGGGGGGGGDDDDTDDPAPPTPQIMATFKRAARWLLLVESIEMSHNTDTEHRTQRTNNAPCVAVRSI